MCGIVGFTFSANDEFPAQTLALMRDELVHRGPDDAGLFTDAPVALAHRRLSIIDLKSGHQPMQSSDGDITITFNGEIYNFREMRKELKEEYPFRTQCDTEVLLYAYQKWGISFLKRLNGMFAFALYDKKKKSIILARDRMGKKPLYYSFDPAKNLYFASEPKALFKHPKIKKELSLKALDTFLEFEYLPVPLSIYKNIFKLQGGECLTYNIPEKRYQINAYWQSEFQNNGKAINEESSQHRFVELLSESVERRLISDVPLGVFLSGGIDSSAIAAMACRHRPHNKVKTFSITFRDKSFDESSYASLVATHLGTEHFEKEFSPKDLLGALPEIISKLDEPLADASLIPSYLLCKFARQHVTVALGGDGADELMAGYPTFSAYSLLSAVTIPKILNIPLRHIADLLPTNYDNISYDFKIKQTLKGLSQKGYQRLTTWMGAFDEDERRDLMVNRQARGGADIPEFKNIYDYYQRTYLQEDILTKVDRASMMNSLEVRAPFLDKELVAFVNNLPEKFKLRFLTSKYILKESLRGILPDQILSRSKKGFGIPVAKWFRGELKQELLTTLDPQKIKGQGIFHFSSIEKIISNLMQGKRDTRKQLWTLYIFQKWFDRQFAGI